MSNTITKVLCFCHNEAREFLIFSYFFLKNPDPKKIFFSEINQAPSPYSMLQHIDKLATQKLVPRNCLRHWQTIRIMGRGGLVSERVWRIVVLSLKNFIYLRMELAKLSYFSITIRKWKNFVEFISKSPYPRVFL